MISTLATLWRVKEIRQKILFTLYILLIYRFGTFVPVPGVNVQELGKMFSDATASAGQDAVGTAVKMVQLFSGGAMARFSLFTLGIMPYISASIIMQIMTAVTPSLKAMQEEGPSGQNRLKFYTRLLTIAICLVQGFGYISLLAAQSRGGNADLILDDNFLWRFQTVFMWTAGAMFVMWLGDQISWKGIGNGASLLIMAGIVVELPAALTVLFNPDQFNQASDPAMIPVILLIYLAMIVGIVFITLAQRRIPIHMAKHVRGMKMSLGSRNFLPLRVNQAGVMPVIFAAVVMQFFGMFLQFLSSRSPEIIGPIESTFQRGPNLGYVLAQLSLIIFFAYFYTAMTFNPKEMADNLKKQGHFVPGLRPGKHTADFLEKVMNRVVLAGAVFLAIIDIVPVVGTGSGVQQLVASFMGGTGLLIVVGVALDLMQKLETEITMRNYEGFMKKRRGRN